MQCSCQTTYRAGIVRQANSPGGRATKVQEQGQLLQKSNRLLIVLAIGILELNS